MAGLPGSGLGGIFYILLVLWFVGRQIRYGRSPPKRSQQITGLAAMSAMMVATMIVIAWGAAELFGRLPNFAEIIRVSDATGRWALFLGLMPLISIATLLGALQVARLVVPQKSGR